MAGVLSHLGSASELGLGPIASAAGRSTPELDNQVAWDHWNAMTPRDQAAAFVASEARLVETFEELSPEQRETLTVDLGFTPQPLPLSTVLGTRLNEQSLHAWDVRVGLDSAAGLDEDSARRLARRGDRQRVVGRPPTGVPGLLSRAG